MRIVIASDSAEERGRYRQAALDAGLECERADCVSLAALSGRLRLGEVDLAIASVSLDDAAILNAAHSATASKVPFYAVCDRHDEHLIPGLLRAGARGYLRPSHLNHDLGESIAEIEAGPVNVDWGKVIAVTSGAGGVGATTVATNLAFALAEQHPRQVVLAQLAAGPSDLAIHLGMRPELPLQHIATGWTRLGSSGLDRYLTRCGNGPMVLVDQPSQTSEAQWTSDSLRHLFAMLRSRFSFVVVDFGHATDSARIDALRLADTVNVVLRLDAPTVMATKQFLVHLRQNGIEPSQIAGIANRYGQAEQWAWPRARTVLGIPITHWVPEDVASANRAVNSRKPLTISAGDSPITESFTRMAARCHNMITARPHALAG